MPPHVVFAFADIDPGMSLKCPLIWCYPRCRNPEKLITMKIREGLGRVTTLMCHSDQILLSLGLPIKALLNKRNTVFCVKNFTQHVPMTQNGALSDLPGCRRHSPLMNWEIRGCLSTECPSIAWWKNEIAFCINFNCTGCSFRIQKWLKKA